MRSNRGSLYSRLEVLEDRLISPLDRRIQSLSAPDREDYERWKQRVTDEFKLYRGEPGSYFAGWLSGETERTPLPRRLEQKLFPDRPNILEIDSENDARDKYEDYCSGS